MRTVITILFLSVVALFCADPAGAETVDMSVYTCQDMMDEKANDIPMLIFWIDGYMSGKSGDTNIDADALGELTEKLLEYCHANRGAKVLDAVRILTSQY